MYSLLNQMSDEFDGPGVYSLLSQMSDQVCPTLCIVGVLETLEGAQASQHPALAMGPEEVPGTSGLQSHTSKYP